MIIEAARSRPTAFLGLLAAAGLAWWITAERMAGMDAGPGTDLGTVGWFAGTWAVMMAAMMLPSLAPTAAGYARIGRGLALALRRPLARRRRPGDGRALPAVTSQTDIPGAMPGCARSSRRRFRSVHRRHAQRWLVRRLSWALMAALFALGVMSLTWMAAIGALVVLEKAAPRPRVTRLPRQYF